MEETIVWAGIFGTKIGKYKDDKYYYLTLNTTPRTPLINTGKAFNSVRKAKKYYLTQLKKVLLDALKEID